MRSNIETCALRWLQSAHAAEKGAVNRAPITLVTVKLTYYPPPLMNLEPQDVKVKSHLLPTSTFHEDLVILLDGSYLHSRPAMVSQLIPTTWTLMWHGHSSVQDLRTSIGGNDCCFCTHLPLLDG